MLLQEVLCLLYNGVSREDRSLEIIKDLGLEPANIAESATKTFNFIGSLFK